MIPLLRGAGRHLLKVGIRNFLFSEHRAIGGTFTLKARLKSGTPDIMAPDPFNATLWFVVAGI